MEDKDRLEGFGQHGERLRVESEVFGHAPGYASVGLRAVYAFRGACMHPYASGDAYVFVLSFGLFPTFRGWSGGVYALYASFPYRGFGKKERNPIY